MQYRSEIDGLRAFAVISVILFHAGFTTFNGGFIGVDVFFVISGYLISTIIIEEIEAGSFDFWSFYERRARRILPALFLVILCIFPIAYVWMLPEELKAFSLSAVSATLFFSNIFFWSQSGYFDTASELKPLLHTWSLGVEEQFYIIFPIFMISIWKKNRSQLIWRIAIILIISLTLSEFSSYKFPSANFYLLPMRAWELLSGTLCSFVEFKKNRFRDEVFSLLGFVIIVTTIIAYNENMRLPSLYSFLPVFGTCLILQYAREHTVVKRLLSIRPIVGLGIISYSTYLWHHPLFSIARLNGIDLTKMQMAGLIFLSMFLAWITWKYVEVPFRNKNGKVFFKKNKLIAILFSVNISIIFIGFGGYLTDIGQSNFLINQRELIASASSSPMRKSCHYDKNNQFPIEASCVYFGNMPTVAVYGNSHGVEFSYGLANELNQQHVSIIQFTISGCAPSFNRVTNDYCDDFFKERLNFLMSKNQISNVILTFRSERSGAESVASLIDLANNIKRSGKNVILLIQAPILKFDIKKYIHKALYSHVETVSSMTRREWQEINQIAYSQLDKVDSGINIIDLADIFCDELLCYAIKNNTAMYFDDNHMSISAAAIVARKIVKYLK